MTLQTQTYTTTGEKNLLSVSPNNNVHISVEAGDLDKYDIDYKVDAASDRYVHSSNLKGTQIIKKLDVPATKVGLNITANESGNIILEIKEYSIIILLVMTLASVLFFSQAVDTEDGGIILISGE